MFHQGWGRFLLGMIVTTKWDVIEKNKCFVCFYVCFHFRGWMNMEVYSYMSNGDFRKGGLSVWFYMCKSLDCCEYICKLVKICENKCYKYMDIKLEIIIACCIFPPFPKFLPPHRKTNSEPLCLAATFSLEKSCSFYSEDIYL